MVTDAERALTVWLIRVRLWKPFISMRIAQINACFGTQWIFNWMRRRQIVDSLKHAPCCPANHYHKMRLVFQRCTCGAVAIEARADSE